MKYFVIFLVLSGIVHACEDHAPQTEAFQQALRLAGENKGELRKVMNHFAQDSLKYEAARFLIENMRWHINVGKVEKPSKEVFDRIREADSIYYFITGGVNNDVLRRGEMNGWLNYNANKYLKEKGMVQAEASQISSDTFPDVANIKADFLISHIDHAFEVWKKSPFARSFSFADFCEYILPYRALTSNSFVLNGQTLYQWMERHMKNCIPLTMPNVAERYRIYIENMRKFTGDAPEEDTWGMCDIFYRKKRDCVPQCDVECSVLRALGVPAAIDVNVGNREYVGQHHHCVVIDTTGKCYPFHGETNISQTPNWGYALEYKLNVYRNMFGAQKDSPYMLRKGKEPLPEGFRLPTIKEVTAYLKKTIPVTLELPEKIANGVAWLYSYARSEQGVRAVTWGMVDSTGQRVRFDNVVPNVLYFPAYLKPDGAVCYFSDPLFVVEGINYDEFKINHYRKFLPEVKDSLVDLIITRKFPRKPNMIKLAREMVGGVFYGANRKDGKDKEKLYTIREAPGACLNEYVLNNRKAYRYYIYEAPRSYWANISVLEFLTDTCYHYFNAALPTPMEIFSPCDTLKSQKKYVKLWSRNPDDPSPEYDGNMQTSSGKTRIVYELEEPQVVTCIHLAPKNADNIIKPFEAYELYRWERGWKLQKKVVSRYHYLEFDSLPADGLYWLRNNSRGKEEVPFVIVNGEAAFIYYDVLKPEVAGEIRVLSRTGWVCEASSQEPASSPYEPGFVSFIADGNTRTIWHTQYTGKMYKYPHWFSVDMGKCQCVDGFLFTPRGRDNTKNMDIWVSRDGKEWEKEGSYKLKNEGKEQRIYLNRTRYIRCFKVVCKDGYEKTPYTSMAEVCAFVKKRDNM